MLHRTLLPVVALFLALGAPVSAAEPAKGTALAREGVAFEHPADWKATVQESEGGPIILLEEPGDAIATVAIFKEGVNVSLDEYAANYIDNIISELPRTVTVKRTGQSVRAGVMDVKFVLTFQGSDLPTTTNVSRHDIAGRTVFCVTQVADEDRKKVQPGFDLIRRTLGAAKK